MGFEPTTFCLGSRRSATELLPQVDLQVNFTPRGMKNQVAGITFPIIEYRRLLTGYLVIDILLLQNGSGISVKSG